MRPVVSSSGKRGPVFSSVGTYSVTTKLPMPRTKPPICIVGVPSGAVLVAWPLDRALRQLLERDAGEGRRGAGDLVHDLRRMRVAPVRPHRAGDRLRRLPVGEAGARRHHLAHQVDAPFGVDERAVLLQERGARQEHVRVVRRLVQEQVVHHDALHRRETLGDVLRVGVGLRDVLALDVDAAERAVDRGVDHVGNAQPRLRPPSVTPHSRS